MIFEHCELANEGRVRLLAIWGLGAECLACINISLCNIATPKNHIFQYGTESSTQSQAILGKLIKSLLSLDLNPIVFDILSNILIASNDISATFSWLATNGVRKNGE
ncbi:unnamed protein product [Citrullus colocynthis]|uniref:Uncharacterized protein n=1 Tax=Citrullus colocynthis TaxID=252529 RepID=A0ABP0XPR6_9ROSI